MKKKLVTNREIIRIGKYLNEIVLVKDVTGKLLHKIIKPIMVEIYPHDIIQLIVGATWLALPIAFTEEVRNLWEKLSNERIFLIVILSLVFVGLFIFFNMYNNNFKGNFFRFIRRVIVTYSISLLISLMILFLLDKAPLGADWLITLKRVIIISFPASMGAAVTDIIK